MLGRQRQPWAPIRASTSATEESAGPLAIYSGVSIDLFSDGVMIGTGTVIDPALGLLLALGQVPADIPEGFAAVATLRPASIARRTRMLMSLSFAIPVLVGPTLGYFARQAPDVLTLSVLAVTGGALTSVVVEEMMTEAHEGNTSRLVPIPVTAGSEVFALISVYVG